MIKEGKAYMDNTDQETMQVNILYYHSIQAYTSQKSHISVTFSFKRDIHDRSFRVVPLQPLAHLVNLTVYESLRSSPLISSSTPPHSLLASLSSLFNSLRSIYPHPISTPYPLPFCLPTASLYLPLSAPLHIYHSNST